jgi:hypothetical protein
LVRVAVVWIKSVPNVVVKTFTVFQNRANLDGDVDGVLLMLTAPLNRDGLGVGLDVDLGVDSVLLMMTAHLGWDDAGGAVDGAAVCNSRKNISI